MKKEYLFSPGPTPVPPQALSAMGRPIFHHRTQRYRDIFKEVVEGLQYVLQTKNDIMVFASSGTGAMEASVCNILSPGDKVISVNGGKFGERWGQLCKAYGANVDEIVNEWGTGPNPEDIKKRLTKDTKAVYITLSETSTGALADVKAIAAIVRNSNAVLVVDTISGLVADDMKTDEWGIDIAVGGSQKGLMIPPGIGFCSVSEKAWKLVAESKCPKFYFSFNKARKALAAFDHPFTPAITLVIALKETLSLIKQAGLENLIGMYAKFAKAIRAAAKALNLEMFAKHPANCVSAIKIPEGIDGEKIYKTLRDDMGVTFAGGQDQLKGKVIRMATMGYQSQFDIITAVSALEAGLKKMGHKFDAGDGVKAAQQVLIG
jgi:aspartate aminotransferase-like enzyme